MTVLTSRLDDFLIKVSTPRHQIGIQYARAAIGAIMLYIYSVNFAQRHFLLGPEAVYVNREVFNPFGTVSPGMFELLYMIALLAALALTFGFGGRVTTAVNLIMFWGWTNAGIMIGDGGDNVLRIALFYLVFADAYRKLGSREDGVWQPLLGLMHNLALLAVALQLSALYLTAGLAKVQGVMWRDGTAMYYVLQVDEFSNPAVRSLLLRTPALTIILTHLTVFFQIAFPWLLLHTSARRWIIAIAASFHLGTAAAMNLISFSLIMIALELTLLPDADYIRIGAWMKVWAQRLRQVRIPAKFRPVSARAERQL